MGRYNLIFLRHAETTYSSVFPDITQNGIAKVRSVAAELQRASAWEGSSNLRIISSLAIRARGTASILAEEIYYDREVAIEPLLSDMHISDWPAALEIFQRCNLHGRLEDVYDTDDCFEDACVFEPRSEIRKRFFRFLHRWHSMVGDSNTADCLFAVSHFELLNHFLHSLWPDAPWLPWAGFFSMSADDRNGMVTVRYGDRLSQVELQPLVA